MSDRFFVDERCGCIAVRDRTLTDPEYQGLHEDTTGVVFYRHGMTVRETCPTCGHVSGRYQVHVSDKAAAILECARLNAIHAVAPPEVVQAWGDGP